MHDSDNTNRFFIITGGPGSGKTAIIDGLQKAGHTRSLEAGRRIIQDQMRIGGLALPWHDRMMFAELMLSWEMRSYRIAEECSGRVFFDRGILDVLGYLRLIGVPVPQHVERAAEVFPYNRSVFIAPPWREIFEQDAERKQDFDEAVRTYDVLAATYTEHGYELIEIPRASIQERADFVLGKVGGVRS